MIFVVESIYILCIFCKLRYYIYLHTTTLILVKGALDAHGSMLMPDKKDFGYNLSWDGLCIYKG